MVALNPQSWYDHVPKDYAENLAYRRKILALGRSSEEAAERLWLACSRDLLFFINTFVWTFDASGTYGNPAVPKLLPFITYPCQDEALRILEAAIATEDVVIRKSRDMGASWMILTLFTWHLDFHRNYSFLMVSRKAELVDKPQDPRSLFWKIDCIHEHLPGFLRPAGVLPSEKNRKQMHVHNEDLRSTIDGEATTGDVARGDRRAGILMDEFAAVPPGDARRALSSTQAATRCRLFNSTPQGVGNPFHDETLNPHKRQIELHWSQVPWKAAGLYTSHKGRLKIIDESHEFPGDYDFVLDGKKRSVYYDAECRRTTLQSLIRQELDIDFLGSGDQFFNMDEIETIRDNYAHPPFLRGELQESDPGAPGSKRKIEFVECEDGRLKLWLHLDADNQVPRDRKYAIGADISEGTGASFSVLAVGDKKTGEKVAEFTSNRIEPHDLAEYAARLATWLTGDDGDPAYLIWEANGPGRSYGRRIMALGHTNVFFKKAEDRWDKKPTDIPGWWATKEEKRHLLREWGRAMIAAEYIERSHDTLNECPHFVFTEDGSVVHSGAKSATDGSSSNENHGDHVTASAVLWRGMGEISTLTEPCEPVARPGSLAYRMAKHGVGGKGTVEQIEDYAGSEDRLFSGSHTDVEAPLFA